MKITFLFICLSVLATVCICQTYTTLQVPSTTPITDFNPCSQNYYTFSILSDEAVPTSYLEIDIESSSQIYYYLSPTNITFSNIITLPGNNQDTTINVVCEFTEYTQWYLLISNEGDVQVDYNLTISVVDVDVTALQIANTTEFNTDSYDFDSFATSADFYSVTFSQIPKQFSSLEVTITSNDQNNTIDSAQINFGNLPYIGCQTVEQGGETITLLVDYCTLQANQAGTYYISVTPEEDTSLTYTVEVSNPAPTVNTLPAGTTGLTGYLLTEGEINFYSVSASEGNVLNFTLTDIVNGELEVNVNYGTLPFFECVNGAPIVSQETSTSCQLIVDYCNSISGVYYIGVQVKSIDDPSLPISYRIFYNQFSAPTAESLAENEYTTGVVSQSFYSHYEFENTDFDVTEDTLLNIRLYVDTYNLGTTSYQVNLYVNYDDPAGPNDSCWSSIEECSIVTGNGQSSCTIQIDPCLFNDHSNWYASVFASDDLIETRVIQYTIIATLENPQELTQQFEIVSSSVYYDNYDHYYLPESLFTLGYQVDILVTSVSDRIQLYANSDGTPAGAIVCPACYNNTDFLSTTNDITYSVVSCPGAEIEDDFYFSIQGQSQGAYSSYSVMYVLSTGAIAPANDLAPDTLAVGSIPANSAVNYTLGIASFNDENQLTIKLSSQNTTGDLSATLYNSLYLNCLEGNEMYSCTVENTGYCTFTVPPCVFTTSDGFILSLSNSDNSETVYYNVEFTNQAVPTTELENNGIVVSEIGQFQYDLYEYTVQSGASTVIVEVVFFDDGEYNPTGFLNVSTLALGTGPCYPDGEVFNCQSDSKCVFVASSCDLQSETLNIAVYTAYNLYPDLPLKYSIVVRQFSSISALPTAVNSQSTFTGQIYPGQQVYHTFPATVNAALGSQVTFQLSGEVTGVVSQSTPPTTDSCPCFEYYPDAVLNPNGNTPVSLTIEYCNQANTNTYTILVEANSDQNPAQQVTYTIIASTFSSTPVPLTVDTVVDGQVIFGYYQYFTIPANNDVVSVSISNIIGGSIGIYYSSTGPATVDCSTGSIVCATPDSACVSQLPACEDITYLSVYGAAADSASPITFSIVISGQNSTELTTSTLSANTTLDASFLSIFSYTVDEDKYTAPIVTFTLSNVIPSNANYRISVYTNDLCSFDFVTSTLSSTVSIPYCQIQDSDLFFYVTSLETQRTIYFTAEVTVVDVYEDNGVLALQDPVTKDLAAGAWVTYEYAQPALDPTQQSSLTFTITPAVNAYFSFGSYPTTQCSDATFTTRYTVNSCCVQEGNYYVAFTSNTADNYTIEVVSTLIAFTEDVTVGTPTDVVTIPASQTAEFNFEITNLNYQTISILIDSSEQVDVSFERISQAGSGLGPCFTDADTFSSGPGTSVYSIEKCSPYFIGTLFVGVTAGNNDSNVTLSVISTAAEDVTTDGTAVPLTAVADITYVYTISVDQTDLLPNQELSVEITSNTVSFVANLYGSSEYCSDNNALDTCTDDESCTLTYLLCNSVSTYTLSVRATDNADISITATIVTDTPTELTAGEATAKPDDSLINLYTFTLTGLENSQYVTVSIVYDDLTTDFAASWRYYAAAPNGIYCLPTDDSENACDEYTQDNTANTTTCTFNIEPCELYAGEFLLQIISNEADDQYEVTYTVSTAAPTPIEIGQTIYGTIDENANHYYQLPFDRTSILPGQSFEIELDVTCGTADLYINQGLLAGPDCSISSTLSYTLDACDLLESSVTSSPDSDFFITIAGGQTTYPQFDVPTTYSLSSAISGSEIKFIPVGPNQAISYDGTPAIYVYNVAGINDFTGELAFTLTINPEVEGAKATVYISADTPYHPLLPCTNQFQTLASTQFENVLYEDSCTVDSVRIFYISFDASSTANSTFMVSRTKQYVRDLNEYNYPQSGAVVGAPVNFDITDEEYFEIEVDTTVAGFRFQATLSTPELGYANLLTSLDSQPSSCNVFAPGTSCSTQNTDGECVVAVDYCEFEDQTIPHIYLTVNTGFNSATPVPYNLSFTQTVTQTTLTPGQSVCGSSNTSWTWYTLPSTATANTFYEFQIYSVSLNEFVDVYLNTEGLATDRCNQYSSTGCTGSCSLVYSCDGFNGQFSLGIEKNNIDTSYFVVVNTIKVNPVALTVGTSRDSDDDTPVAVGGTEYYFYSFNAPDLNEAAGQSLILTVSSETPVTVSYNIGSPSINCVDDEGAGTNVVFFVNSCDYATGTVYVTVSGSDDFTIEASILSPTVTPIALNSYVEGSLFIDTTEDSFPSFTSYSITLGENDIQAADSFTVNVYGINQGALTIWISENQIADISCAVASFTQDTVTLNSCDLTAGTYFVNVLLTTPGQINPCTPVTFGILVTSNQPATPYNFVTLTSGVASTSSAFFTNNVYSFTPSNPSSSLVIVTTTSTVPLTVSSSCDVISSPVQYFFGCSAQTEYTFTVVPTLSTLTLPTTQYNITATTANINVLSSTPLLALFTQEDYEALIVFKFTVTSEASLEVIVDVTNGPSVEIQLWSAECVDGANQLIDTFTCYYGTCVLPVSQRQSVVANATDSDDYFVTVSGYSPASFTIAVSQGEEETCSVPNEDDLQFCTIVEWSTWSYESDTNIIVAQDETAQRKFDYLYLKFCPPCVCEELSEACNSSLTEYVCTQTFRACDYDGFETSICLTSCQDVEQNCGKTFEEIGLPELSCNHNFYLLPDDPICEDIYQTTSSNSELILWIVVGVVLFIVVVVLISVAVVVGYKQVQAKRRASSYEVLE